MKVNQIGSFFAPKNENKTVFKSTKRVNNSKGIDNSELLIATLSALSLGGIYAMTSIKKQNQINPKTIKKTVKLVKPDVTDDGIKLYRLRKQSEQSIINIA